ncbi:uncharacterized protein LOC119687005 [Teleopsis dalmanni]|uniref:uncharacterized protein LOC119687005 n=1 Tax=Teleopsis dalmanni TaxID=139649 RepID=UPI0018CCE2AD|nr:uncharacterized protein LOC119687005 [Teleopsis dalmanni]XP_037957073.1 uncharacterized protein LOC119687005 [Teleopsis dalmanni]
MEDKKKTESRKNSSRKDIPNECEEDTNPKVTRTTPEPLTVPINLSVLENDLSIASIDSFPLSPGIASIAETKPQFRRHYPNTCVLENLTFGERGTFPACNGTSILIEYCNDEFDAEQETELIMWKFMLDNETLIKQFGMIRNRVDSKYFLQTHTHLLSEHVANYMVVWSINLILQKSIDLLNNVAHQLMCLQYIMEVSNSLLETDPLFCISSFFLHMTNWDLSERREFASDIDRFKQRLTKFTEGDIWGAFADAAIDERERKELADPNCFAPVNVYKELPIVLRKRIEMQKPLLIRKTFDALPEEISKYFFKCCVDCDILNSECIVNMDVVEHTLITLEEEKLRETAQDDNKTKHILHDSDAENSNDDRVSPGTPRSFEYNTSDTDESTQNTDSDPNNREFIFDIIMPQERVDTNIYKFVEQKFQETIAGIKTRSGNKNNLNVNAAEIIKELGTRQEVVDDDYDSDFSTNNNVVITDISEDETDEDFISGTDSQSTADDSVDGDESESLTEHTSNEKLIKNFLKIEPVPSEELQTDRKVFNGVVIPNSIGSLPLKFVDKTHKNLANSEIVKSNLLSNKENLLEQKIIFNVDEFTDSQIDDVVDEPVDNVCDTNGNFFSLNVNDVEDDANVEDPEVANNQKFLNKILSALGSGTENTFPTTQQFQIDIGLSNLGCKVPNTVGNQQNISFSHNDDNDDEDIDNFLDSTLKDEFTKEVREDIETANSDISEEEAFENNNTLEDIEEPDSKLTKKLN